MSEDIHKMSDEQEPDCSEVLLRNGHKPNNFCNNVTNVEKNSNFQLDLLQSEYMKLRRYVYGLTAVVIAGIIILIVVVAVLFGKLSHDLVNHEHKPKVGEQIATLLKKDDLCIPCNNIRLGPSAEENTMLDKFARKHEPEGEMCCVETPSELLLMLELFIEKRFRQEYAKGNIPTPVNEDSGNIRPAAHLLGSMEKLDENLAPGNQFDISKWMYDADIAFTDHVIYRSGRLVVPSDGLYYVYSQISFLEMFNSGMRDSSSSHTLSHYLYRYNIIYPRGGEEKLTHYSISKCRSFSPQFGEYSSHIGAMFKLRKGDEIFVKVSNLTLVNQKEPKLNYFGLFKLI